MQSRFNILYLHSHDTGRYLSPMDQGPDMPGLQRLADQGVLYRQAFCVSPTCSPSRAGWLTGQYPHQCGQWGLPNFGCPLQHPERHLVHHLRSHGWYTVLLGVQHIVRDEHELDYDEIRPEIRGCAFGSKDPFLRSESVTPAAVAWLKQHASDRKPWFLDVGVLETHNSTWRFMRYEDLPNEVEESRLLPPSWVPDLPESRHWRARFGVAAQALDAMLEQVFGTLDELGLSDNTLVVYTSDHGPGTPFAKCTLSDAGLGVGLVMRGPGGFRGGRVIHTPVSHLDLYPTVCDVCGIKRPEWLEGLALPIEDKVTPEPRVLFSEINYHGSALPERAICTPSHKLIHRVYSDPASVYQNTDKQPLRKALSEAGWPRVTQDPLPSGARYTDQLFDLRLDPTERCDRSKDSRYQQIYQDLSCKLETWMTQTADVLAQEHGQLPRPQTYENEQVQSTIQRPSTHGLHKGYFMNEESNQHNKQTATGLNVQMDVPSMLPHSWFHDQSSGGCLGRYG